MRDELTSLRLGVVRAQWNPAERPVELGGRRERVLVRLRDLRAGDFVAGFGKHVRRVSPPARLCCGQYVVEWVEGGVSRWRGEAQVRVERLVPGRPGVAPHALRRSFNPREPRGRGGEWVKAAGAMSGDELRQHLANFHGGPGAGGAHVGPKRPSVAFLRNRHEQMHAGGPGGNVLVAAGIAHQHRAMQG